MTDDIRPGVSSAAAAGRLQVLATEHWGLLATRTLTYNEALSRVTIFLGILSGSIIALALVAQADGFGRTSMSIAIPVLTVVLFTGIATVRRLIMLNIDDFRWVVGMNRLRHAYLQMYPELEPHFVTSQYDDMAGALQSLGIETVTSGPSGGSLLHVVQTLPGMLAVVVGAVAAALGALAALLLGALPLVTIIAAAAAFLIVLVLQGIWNRTSIRKTPPSLTPRFPSPQS